jgi:hypothetical protein
MVRLHSWGLSLLGTDFKRLIVCRPRSNDGVETINFLKEEHGTWLRKRWKFVLISSSPVVIFLFSCIERIMGKKSTANLVLYNTTEVCLADTLPWLEVGL